MFIFLKNSVYSCHLPLSTALLYKNDVKENTTMNPSLMPARLGITVGFDCCAWELPSPSSVSFLGTEVGGLVPENLQTHKMCSRQLPREEDYFSLDEPVFPDLIPLC